MSFFWKGIILGFSIAAPVGPIGVLCIRKTLQFGRWSGLCSGLGAATADMMYGIIAVFGLDLLSSFLILGDFWMRLVGGIFLLFLGYKTFTSKPQERGALVTHVTLIKDFFSTFFLTLTNPMTIFSYVAIFAGLGLLEAPGNAEGILILGVFLGSALWWLLLSEGVTLFRKRVSDRVMLWINRLAGILIAGFGLAALISTHFS
jgi:threonine/homoserine/homoserine lactone efflux protein